MGPAVRPGGALTNFAAMAFPDDPDDEVGFVPPLPPEDRLWRHPSERAVGGRTTVLAPTRRRGRARVMSILTMATALVAMVVALSSNLPGGGTARTATSADEPTGEDAPATVTSALVPALVRITAERPEGRVSATGVLVRDDGHLVTTADPLRGATSITVHTADGASFNATLVGTDRADDLAVLDIAVNGAPVARLADADPADIGEPVYVIGRIDSIRPWVSSGAIDAIDDRVVTSDGSVLVGMLRTALSATATPDGAVVCTDDGTVVGIVTARTRRTTTSARSPVTLASPRRAMAWATPSPWILRVATDIIESGTHRRGWIGVLTEDLGDGGVVVRSVTADGPAARAGLAADDRIVSVDSVTVNSPDDLVLAIRGHRRGDRVVVETIRDGMTRTLGIVVSEPAGVDAAATR